MATLGFIGSGNMAEAILRAALGNGIAAAGEIYASDPYEPRRALFAGLGVNATEDNAVVAKHAGTILLCCKPQQMKDVLVGLRESLPETTLLISIAAGIPTGAIRGHLGRVGQPVVRVMPNTPLLVGAGMSAISAAEGTERSHLATARALFEGAGKVIEVGEDLLDAVTAVSGSGPAYYFFLTEHLAKTAVAMGFDEGTAQVLARQTALGSALMLAQSSDSPEELRRKVTSPKGTTQAAVEYMEAQGLPQIVRDGVIAARDRSVELRQGK